MTNYEYLTSLPVEKFSVAIASVVDSCGGNSELLLRYLNAEYMGVKKIRDVLNENYSGVTISFRYGGAVYSCVSVDDFLKQYGTLASGILDMRVVSVRAGRNGNKTVVL